MKPVTLLFRTFVLIAAGLPTQVFAQGLDPTFPQIGSTADFTSAAFLDLDAQDTDRASLLVPRGTGGGATMVFLARFTDSTVVFNRVGTRRMFGAGESFGPNVSTTLALPEFATLKSGVELADKVCLLQKSFNGTTLRNEAFLYCLTEDGTASAPVATPVGVANRVAGALAVEGGDLIVVGTFTLGGLSDEHELYFERRRASDLVSIAPRVDHKINIGASVVVNNFLEVAELQRDAQGRWLVAGRAKRADGSASKFEGFVARFNADFSRDASFGVNGVVNLNFGAGPGGQFFNAEATDVAVLDNGYIVATGLGCRSLDCGTISSGATLERQTLIRLMRPDGINLSVTNSFVSPAAVPRSIQVEATRPPYLGGNQTGYITVEDNTDNRVLSSITAINGAGVSSFGDFSFFGLRYSANPMAVVPQTFVDLVTTTSSGGTRHFAAWTYLANTGNATDTDMAIGELGAVELFRNGFESTP